MASLVQSVTGAFVSTLTLPANPTAGNLLVVCINVTDNASVIANSISGWTTVSNTSGIWVAARTSVGAADKTVNFTGTVFGAAMTFSEVSGVVLSGYSVTQATSAVSRSGANGDFVISGVLYQTFTSGLSAGTPPTMNAITGMTKLKDGTDYYIDSVESFDIGFGGTVCYALPTSTTTYSPGSGTTASVATVGTWGGTWSVGGSTVVVFPAAASGSTLTAAVDVTAAATNSLRFNTTAAASVTVSALAVDSLTYQTTALASITISTVAPYSLRFPTSVVAAVNLTATASNTPYFASTAAASITLAATTVTPITPGVLSGSAGGNLLAGNASNVSVFGGVGVTAGVVGSTGPTSTLTGKG